MKPRLGVVAGLLCALILGACSLPSSVQRTPSGPADGSSRGGRTPSGTDDASSAGSPSGSRGGTGSSSAGPRPGEGGRSAPIPDRAITISGRCVQTEDDGFREDATLVVSNNLVKSVAWQLWVGKRGGCTFRQEEFRQTQHRPHIEMTAVDGSGCKLLVWQDPRRITLAHNGCQRRCSPGIYEEAWPVMFDPASGSCSKED